MHQRPPQRDPLPLARGEPPARPVEKGPEIERFREPANPCGDRTAIEPVEPREEVEHLPRREPVGHAGGRGDIAEVASDPDRVVAHVATGDPRRPRGRPEERGQDPHGGGLAGAVAAQQPHHLTVSNRERHAVHGPHRPAAGTVLLRELVNLDHGRTREGRWRITAPSLPLLSSVRGRRRFPRTSWSVPGRSPCTVRNRLR